MADVEKTKRIEMAGNSYVIGRFNADTGSWLLMRMMKSFREFMKTIESEESDENAPEPENFAEQLIQTLLSDLSPEDFKQIQRQTLLIVKRVDVVKDLEVLHNVIRPNGDFSFADLRHDIDTVMCLTSQALFFNLAPFFTKSGLRATMQGKPLTDLSQ
jgi:hypothetical protein